MKGFTEKYKGYAFIAFVDILGFKEEIEKFWENQEFDPLKRMLSIVKKVKKLKGNDQYSVMDDDEKEIETYQCNVKILSDSFIVLFALNSRIDLIKGDELVLGLLSVTQCVKTIWENCLKAGFTIRGGIDLEQIFWDNDNIVGPGLIHAYELEKNYAKTSRVIISSNINNLLLEFEEVEGFKNIIIEEFYKDIDGYIAINPNLIYTDNKKKLKLIKKLKKTQNKLTNFNHREKYTPLIAILEMGDKTINQSFEIFGHY